MIASTQFLRNIIIIYIFSILWASDVSCQSKQDSNKLLDNYFLEKINEYRFPGISVLAVRRDSLLYKFSRGNSSIEYEIPISDSTAFHLASVTKIFTSTTILRLVAEGTLELEKEITSYSDKFPEEWKNITVKHLLNHTSGIKNHFRTQLWLDSDSDKSKLSLLETLDYSFKEGLQFPPGEKFSYSVTGYIVLAFIVEEITGNNFSKEAERLIYAPLLMDSAKYGDAKAIIKNRNPMIYTFQNGPFENWNFDYGLAQTTAAGLNMSIVDLGKFFSNIEELVPDSNTWRLVGDGYKLNENLSSHYGLGWTVRNINGKIYFGHEGGGCCWVEYCPKDKAYYIILTNLTGARADEMIVKLIESLSD